jgi:hypothetical protein
MKLLRLCWRIREGHSWQEVMDVTKEAPDSCPKPTRILSSGMLSPWDGFIFEYEFANLADLEKAWEAFMGSEADEFLKKWTAVCEQYTLVREVWEIVQ